MNPVVLTCALIIVGIGISLFGLYALIEKAVKDALKEFDREKNEQAESKR